MARKAQINFARDSKDNITVTVAVDTQGELTENEIRNDPMLSLVYRCLAPVLPYVKKPDEQANEETKHD